MILGALHDIFETLFKMFFPGQIELVFSEQFQIHNKIKQETVFLCVLCP